LRANTGAFQKLCRRIIAEKIFRSISDTAKVFRQSTASKLPKYRFPGDNNAWRKLVTLKREVLPAEFRQISYDER
jgi:hypothetical protein